MAHQQRPRSSLEEGSCGGGGGDGEKSVNTAFVDGVRKFIAMNVRDLDIDLIDSINPFGEAYSILAKTMSEESLKEVQAVINAKRVTMTPEEARDLAKRALKFKLERGRLPSITSADAWEMRSLQRALNKDDAGRRITDPVAGPLFSGEREHGDEASGTIYVLRSKSDHPIVTANRDVVHKIGVTTLDVAQRIAGARLQPTFLMADVEVVATYKLFNISETKLENLIHRVFGPARLEIEVKDRFGNPVTPRECFLVPLFVIDEAVERIKNGSITAYVYDPAAASLRKG